MEAEAHQADLGSIDDFRSGVFGRDSLQHRWQRHSHSFLVAGRRTSDGYISCGAIRSRESFGRLVS